MGCAGSTQANAAAPDSITTTAPAVAKAPAFTQATPTPTPVAKTPASTNATPAPTPAAAAVPTPTKEPSAIAQAPAMVPAQTPKASPAVDEEELSDFQKAYNAMERTPDHVANQITRMLGSTDSTVANLLDLARIVNMQCLIRTFLAKRRIAKIKKQREQGPSDFEIAMAELEKLPPHMAREVRRQMEHSDRPVHVLIKWSAIILAQTLVRGYIGRQKAKRKKAERAISRINSGASQSAPAGGEGDAS